MEWKAEEDIICCEVCVYEYVIKKNDTEIKTCIETIKKHASICRRGEESIKNRIQNIKFWLDELYIENNIPVTPLSHAANQTKKCLLDCLKNTGMYVLKEE